MELPMVKVKLGVEPDRGYVEEYSIRLLICKSSTASALIGILLVDKDIYTRS
jgi:hypothetical protein